MRLSTRFRYVLYISALHAVLLFLVYKILYQDKLLFIASEIFLLLSVLFSIVLYRNFMRPIEFVRSGIEAIKEKDFTIKFVPTGKGEVDTLIEVYNLMIDQLREERTKLHEQHFFLEKLIAASPISIIILDFDDCIESMNVKAAQHFKDDIYPYKGRKLGETGHPLLMELAHIPDGESRVVKTNGVVTFKVQRSHFMDQGFRRSFLMIEELTNELLESEKNAYGKVIRMMAHEVNNTLGATDSILQTTGAFLTDESFRDIKEAILVASERNRRLTRFMRNFADVVRLPLPVRENTDVSKLVRDVVVFMEPAAAGNGISIRPFLPDLPVIKNMDTGQMEHVLVNVIKNAIEACSPGNEIQIEFSEANLMIRNNGAPIETAVGTQLFNPFFSTKRDGQGIGLTLTKEILLNHGFEFSLETDSNGWTVFAIEFK
ncbi:sensor histidine kinase [Dyadobacter sediminis]|uniref:histidine kinase n=1 Tax=Dyadobacter sediminis TaxID=1493691 RepID=A0A5R9KK24_9BACT|nr:ATP-binding protein [Dyadobacter sediminis]TLU96534.1 HAMP domain-containing protein [Dyadobacter sediminis]GGB83000.1 sensor histidine kinase [Dyadobacter sediminis]